MSSPDHEAPSRPEIETGALPDASDRELLDYLIERAWQEILRGLAKTPENDNATEKRAA